MNKKSAMSTMGYAIVSVIVLGMVMIISAPMLVDSVKDKKPAEPEKNFAVPEIPDNSSELRELESRLSACIDNLEQRQTEVSQQPQVTNKYVCTIEGSVDEAGNLVPVDSPNKTEKIVLVCEYKM